MHLLLQLLTCVEITVSFNEQEYTAEEGSYLELYLEFEGYLQREVTVYIFAEEVFDILTGGMLHV